MVNNEDFICECPQGWCEHYQMKIYGHEYDLTKLDNALGKQVRSVLRRKARIAKLRPVSAPKPCNCGGKGGTRA